MIQCVPSLMCILMSDSLISKYHNTRMQLTWQSFQVFFLHYPLTKWGVYDREFEIGTSLMFLHTSTRYMPDSCLLGTYCIPYQYPCPLHQILGSSSILKMHHCNMLYHKSIQSRLKFERNSFPFQLSGMDIDF